ncbi:allene oxide synthase-lipoxygenase protein-like [Tubulanus polymorphus]|uniref:allene oxide synthase-lipoxygenase protein-like n=1 Tax=Tubulanus polymorphus TaxID=672921 RepID=UPI003DA2C6A7
MLLVNSCASTIAMGNNISTLLSPVVINVKTGDRKGAGTDSDIKVRLHDDNGKVLPEVLLDNLFRNDLERNTTDSFRVPLDFPDSGPLTTIEIVNDSFGLLPDWYVEKIEVKHKKINETFVFPIYRWIKPNCPYVFRCLDTSLPQNDPHIEQRQRELKEKQAVYKYTEKVIGAPVQVENLPEDEKFSERHTFDMMYAKFGLLGERCVLKILSLGERWSTLDDLTGVYRTSGMPVPKAANYWKDDVRFAAQRLIGSNPSLIKRCNEIPSNFAVTEEMVSPIIEGSTLSGLIDAKRLYIIDLKILEGIKCSDERILCAPLALFFVNESGKLMPLAIQLHQTPSETNPVFLPTDDTNVWLLAKMWYNNADLSHHQALTHLGFSHLVMESIAVCSHRNISPSHPIFKLLAPHYLNIMAINSLALQRLVSPGGWIDKTMTIGRIGLFEIIVKAWSNWRLDIHGDLPNELKMREVEDAKYLPNYHYREDALLCYEAIKEYVTEIIDVYYDDDEILKRDREIQNWAEEMSKPVPDGGCGIKGVPGEGRMEKKGDLISVCTSVIYICSVGHAAANFNQYEDYAFPPYYPACLHGKPPTSKAAVTEKDIINVLPTRDQTLDTMVVTKMLSKRATQPLGHFELTYAHDPKALQAIKRFQDNLRVISATIRNLNDDREIKYTTLDPAEVPNSISI